MTTPEKDPKRRALGRGLESLLPARAPAPETLPSVQASAADGQPLELALDKIERNPFQTRTNFDEAKLTELAASIKASGVLQPIVVRPLAEGKFQLITGERRVLASRLAGKETIPGIVRVVSDEQAMEMTIVENLQRADLNPMEQARAFYRLGHDFKMTQEQMAIRTGMSRVSIGNFVRLLRLPELVQGKIEAGELSFGHGRALLGLETPAQMLAVAVKVMALSFSVRQTETYVNNLMNPEPRPQKEEAPAPATDPNVHDIEELIQRTIGLRVKVEDRQGRGRVIIEYADLKDFDSLMTTLNVRPN